MSTPEPQASLWDRVKDRPGALGADREAALAHVRGLARAQAVRSREEAMTFLAGVGDAEARELMLVMALTESNYGLTERLVTTLSAQGDAVDAAKALHLADLHSAKASAFAFRRMAKAIAERLGLAENDLKGALSGVELDLFRGRLATLVPAKASGPSAGPALAPVPAARARLHPALAVVLIAALVAAAAGLALWPRLQESLDAAGERTVTIAPKALVSAAAPASYTHAKVTWTGVVENAVALTKTLYIKTGDGAQVIAVYDSQLPDLRPGDPVSFTGRITGRSRFGPIHLRGLTVERTR